MTTDNWVPIYIVAFLPVKPNIAGYQRLVSYVPLENFSLIWRRHHYRRMAAHFDLCSALMAIKQ